MIVGARMEDLMANVDKKGLRRGEEEAVVKIVLVQVRGTPALVGCEVGCVPMPQERTEEEFA